MLTPARLKYTAQALAAVVAFREPADTCLGRFFRAHPNLGPRERAFVAETTYAVLRRKFYLDHVTGSPAPRKLLLAYFAKLAGLPREQLSRCATIAEARWLEEIKSVPPDTLPIGTQAEFPDWLLEKLQLRVNAAEVIAMGRGMQQPAPLDVRVNTLLASRDEVLRRLNADGIAAEATPISPLGLRLREKPALNQHALFLEGKLEVQDEGSQLLGFLLAPARRDMVVDFCAGAGGKTLMLGALMRSQGRIYAFDISDKRLAKFKPRLQRSRLSNVYPQRISGENDLRVKRLASKIDRVLVDAPCSGLGTLRRNPDLKWRQSAKSIEELKRKQGSILAAAATLLKPGGRLVYATCSFLPEENEDVVAAFLERAQPFRLLSCAEILRQQKIALDTGIYLKLCPHIHGTDGFFAAVMEKIPR